MLFRVLTHTLLVCMVVTGVLLKACGDPNDISEQIPLTTSPGGTLTPASHPEGWGHAECFVCHPLVKLHLSSLNPTLDLEEIRQIVSRNGLNSCAACHGRNGT
jgi:hypothetical protein